MVSYQIQIDVTVEDVAKLKAYALKRALEASFTREQFEEGEHPEPDDNVSYWLGWALDNGTPLDCGFTIDESRVEEN